MTDFHPVIKATKLEAAKAADPMEPSEEWLKSRSQSVGSSDIAGAVIGGSQYSSPAKVWEAKRSGIAKPPNNAMLAGSWLQPHIEALALAWIRQFYPDATLFPGAEETYEATTMAGMTCTPDLLIATNTNPDDDPTIPRGIVVEIKFTTNSSNYIRKVETEKGIRDIFWPPDHVLRQVQHQLAILDGIYGNIDYDDLDMWQYREDGGFDWAGAIAVFPLGYTPAALMGPGQHIMVSPAPIRPSRLMLKEMEAAGKAMLGCLRDGVAPWNINSPNLPAYYANDKRDKGMPDAAETLAKKNSVSVAKVETINLIDNMKVLEETIKPDQAQIAEVKEHVKDVLKSESADKLLTEDGEILASYSAADVLDWDAFLSETGLPEYSDMLESVICHPQAAAKHTKPSDKTRRLSIKRS